MVDLGGQGTGGGASKPQPRDASEVAAIAASSSSEKRPNDEHDEVGWAYGVLFDDLQDCGCGYFGRRLTFLRDALRAMPLYEAERWREYDSALGEWFLCLLDGAGLTEHGNTIRDAWLTDKGQRFLTVLNDPVGFGMLYEGEAGYCEHCLDLGRSVER